jgi:hypothetical protein
MFSTLVKIVCPILNEPAPAKARVKRIGGCLMIAKMEHGYLIEPEAKPVKKCSWKSAETCKQCKIDYPGIKCEEIEKQG